MFAQILKEKNKTQKQLANDLSVSQQLISRWAKGLSTPRLKRINEIANKLNVSVEQLIECFSKTETDSEQRESRE